MGKFKPVMIGAALGAAGMYFGLQYHVLLAPEGMLLVPRAPQHSLTETYANVKTWDSSTWIAHPRVSLAVTEYGRADLIGEGVTSEMLDQVRHTLTPQQQQIGNARSDWEPAGPGEIPSPIPDGKIAGVSSTGKAAPKRGFLSLGDLFGLGGGASHDGSNNAARRRDETPVYPAGRTSPPEVEFLPSPDEVQYGQPQRLQPRPGSKWRQSDAESDEPLRSAQEDGGWEPLTVLPPAGATI